MFQKRAKCNQVIPNAPGEVKTMMIIHVQSVKIKK